MKPSRLALLVVAVTGLLFLLRSPAEDMLPPPMNPVAAEWSAVNALVLAEASSLAYGDTGVAEVVKKVLRCTTFEPLTFPLTIPKSFHFEEGEPGPQAFIAGGEELIVIAFRGTEINLADIITDAWAQPIELSGKVPGRVHGGFGMTCSALWPDLLTKLTALRTQFPRARIWLTGHSLGGGLATMAAARLIFDEKVEVQGVLTFGTSVTGDEIFHRELDKALAGRHWRCIHQLDPVTLDLSALKDSGIPFIDRVPGIDGFMKAAKTFRHGGTPKYLSSDGTLNDDVASSLTGELLELGIHWVKERSFSMPADVLERHSIGRGYVPALRKLAAVEKK
jgi:hypothetical protein